MVGFHGLSLISYTRRYFSSIQNPNFSTKKMIRDALTLLRTEKDPNRILEICRSVKLTPEGRLDRIIFSIAIAKLRELNKFEGIRSFIEELKTLPHLKNERFSSHAIVLYGQSGMLDDAKRTFEEMEEMGVTRSTKCLNALLFSCILAGRYDDIHRIFQTFPEKYSIQPDIQSYNTVIKAMAESGSSLGVFSIVREMEKKRIKPNVTSFNNWISGLYNEEKHEDVGRVLDMMEMNNISPGISTYNVRIHSLCKLGRSMEAKALSDGMLSKGIAPTSVTYGHLIHGFCKEGMVDEGKMMFEKMTQRGCKPDANCYFTLIHFLCKEGDFEAALRFCKASMEKGWFPNFTTMHMLVNGLVSVSMVGEARQLISRIKEKFSTNFEMWDEIEASLPSEM